jgi:hypothetical protein
VEITRELPESVNRQGDSIWWNSRDDCIGTDIDACRIGLDSGIPTQLGRFILRRLGQTARLPLTNRTTLLLPRGILPAKPTKGARTGIVAKNFSSL